MEDVIFFNKNNIDFAGVWRIRYFFFAFYFLNILDVSGLTIFINMIVPNRMGYNMLQFILLLPFFRISNTSFAKGFRYAIRILVVYVLIQFARTCITTSVWQALTVFRYSFMQCLNFAISIPFILSLSKKEMDYLLHLILKGTVIFCLVYLSDVLIYDWMRVSSYRLSTETQGNVSVFRSIIGYPLLDPFWVSLFIPLALLDYKRSQMFLFLFLFTLFITYTRNQLASAVVIFAVVVFLVGQKNINYIGKVTKFLFVIALGLIVVAIVLPDSISFWMGKIGNTVNNDFVKKTGTFEFRLRLIEQALSRIEDTQWFGIGYINEMKYGKYSLVIGGDTYIAPILWCEGWVGIILRALPFVILALNSLISYIKRTQISVVDLAIISGFIGSTFNYVQTKALTNYALIIGMYFIIKRKQFLDNNYEQIENVGYNGFV